MIKILVVEDGLAITDKLKNKICALQDFSCDTVSTLAGIKEKIEKNKQEYFVAVVDLSLPDAQHDEVLDYMLAQNTPSIVLTPKLSDEVRKQMYSKHVLEYIVKNEHAVNNLSKTILRIYKNQFIKIMVVDDSKVIRHHAQQILQNKKFIVLEARNGYEALDLLEKNQDIKLILSDYYMPRMDGFELISNVRKRFSRDQLAIIGISSSDSEILSTKFLRNGANDFVTKPIKKEELYLRIKQNIELLEQIEELQKLSNVDYLTQLYNRRFFFELGNKMFENVKRKNLEIITAMIDIDRFKSINDNYGHDIGDLALKHIARLLTENFYSTDIICRYGGEEFCVLAINMNREYVFQTFEKIREVIEKEKLHECGIDIHMTVSIGVATQISNSLDETIKKADRLLYQAKKDGRNRVVLE